jgi:hypothetical protein
VGILSKNADHPLDQNTRKRKLFYFVFSGGQRRSCVQQARKRFLCVLVLSESNMCRLLEYDARAEFYRVAAPKTSRARDPTKRAFCCKIENIGCPMPLHHAFSFSSGNPGSKLAQFFYLYFQYIVDTLSNHSQVLSVLHHQLNIMIETSLYCAASSLLKRTQRLSSWRLSALIETHRLVIKTAPPLRRPHWGYAES